MLPGSVSVGILAGVVSGLFYLVVRYMGKLRSSLQLDSEESACAQCISSTSQHKCPACNKHRELKLQTGDWFYRQLQGRFCRNSSNNNNIAAKNGEGMDPESTQVRDFIERLVEALVSGQLDDVKVNRLYTHPEYDRMFSCHHTALVETLVRLSFALQMAIANKPLNEEDSPSAVHTSLKQRVQEIIQEAMTLPNLKSQVSTQNSIAAHKWEEDISAMSYEDILATAILNKVIERFQQRTGIMLCDGNSNLLPETSSKYISRVEIGVNGTNSLEDGDTSSQDGLRSWSESSHAEPVSMTIEECIEEEVTTYNSEGEEEEETRPPSELDFYLSGLNFIKQRRVPFPELGVDIVDDEEDEHPESPQPTDLVSPVDSWEENWLFQRRRLKVGGSAQQSPIPVPMLVPNPSEDFRALIGDRDAEEVSDLSDCSDGVLEDIVLAGVDTRIPEITISHEHVQQLEEEQEVEEEGEEEEEEEEVDDKKHTTGTKQLSDLATNTELVKTASMECLSEFGQQDSEYTEDYASITQRQLSSLTLPLEPCESVEPTNPVKPTEPVDQVVLTPPVPKPRSVVPQQKKQDEVDGPDHDSELATPPRPGTIAEREHRKWQSAVPLPNNPYSPENINKRLSKKSDLLSYAASPILLESTEERVPLQVVNTSVEPNFSKYGRDYYINESKFAAGARRSPPQKFQDMPEMEQEQDSGVETSDTSQGLQLSVHVENEIARWQKGIDQTEQQWLNKLASKQSSPIVMAREEKQAPSECSTVSSDLDFDADVPIVLPSVKELAKHFGGGATSDSDSSQSKAVPTWRRKPESLQKTVEPPRPIVTEEKREIHSLTARSISREFREGLRRNLPTRLDRNLHSKQDSASSSPEPVNGNEYHTTPGYTSDESGTRSPTPPVGGRRRLQNNIAFWEQLSGK